MKGSSASCAVGLGEEFLLVPAKDKPLLHLVGVQKNSPPTRRTILPGVLGCLAVSPDGSLICGAIQERLYLWLTGTGDLLCVVTGHHYQSVSRLAFSGDGRFLASAGNDGNLLLWTTNSLIERGEAPEPLRKWTAHSLPITGLQFLPGPAPRLLTSSTDQTVKLHELGGCLWTGMVDSAVTAAEMDAGESLLFLATARGLIAQLNFYRQVERELHISTVGSGSAETPLFKGHKTAVVSLAVAVDGGTLASGDDGGGLRLWHIPSKQCLHTFAFNGPVRTLSFLWEWASLRDGDYAALSSPPVLAKHVAPDLPTSIPMVLGSKACGWTRELISVEEEFRRLKDALASTPQLDGDMVVAKDVGEESVGEMEEKQTKKKKPKKKNKKRKIITVE